MSATATDPAKHERAALDVLALLPEWWAVGPTSYDPGTAHCTCTARVPHPVRGKVPETVTGIGDYELAAMSDLAVRLDKRRVEKNLAERPKPRVYLRRARMQAGGPRTITAGGTMVSPGRPKSHNAASDVSFGLLDMSKPHRDWSPSHPLAVGSRPAVYVPAAVS